MLRGGSFLGANIKISISTKQVALSSSLEEAPLGNILLGLSGGAQEGWGGPHHDAGARDDFPSATACLIRDSCDLAGASPVRCPATVLGPAAHCFPPRQSPRWVCSSSSTSKAVSSDAALMDGLAKPN